MIHAVTFSLALLILRVTLGGVLFAHGAQKMLGWFGGRGFNGAMQYFTNTLGMPRLLGWVAILGEFFGSIAVVLGLFTRLAALGLMVMMVVASIRVNLKPGFFMNWGSVPNRGEGYEFTLTLALCLLAVALMGGGQYSLDALIW